MYAENCPNDANQVRFSVTINSLEGEKHFKAHKFIDSDTSFGMIDLHKLPPGQF